MQIDDRDNAMGASGNHWNSTAKHTLTWTKLVTNGELLPPRAGHTNIALGKNLFVFGGFTDAEDLYNDLYMFDLETFTWTKVMTIGEGPSARFSMAGSTLHPQHGGALIFIGGCNKKLEALDDMFYRFTGIVTENGSDERNVEKLSLRKQLILKSQEHQGGVKSSLEVNKLNPSTAAEDTANSIPNPNLGHDGESQPLTGEEHGQQV
ncbi:unnamed protein product [Lactuca virosa]|uniref:Uncharacterized protein n=1 Tax=Lactuca virosa TaxID=75947 RepID=A0AAU9MZL7_9ASTR|nr:unnamed protein product [Lactuca virosa]